MRRLVVAIIAVFVLAIPAVAQAANPHFRRNGIPRCTDTGTQLNCTGSLTGLGNENLVINLTSSAFATFLCGSPGSGNIAPGQNKVPFQASGSQSIPGSAIKNGNATFNVTAPTSPPSADWQTAGCANRNWQVIALQDVDFANITLTISQGGVLLFTCRYPGEVPEGGTVTLSC